MDLELINTFRDKVDSNGFVLFKYRDVKGKDQWSCICSAMDWITVAMEYIVDVEAGKKSCKQSMEMYAYISSIDVVWEAVQQLHRVLLLTQSDRAIPKFAVRKIVSHCLTEKVSAKQCEMDLRTKLVFNHFFD